jgi:nitrile hydratase subunit beta
MNGVHDMGGMHGFGPIVREVNEPLFHATWEAHVLVIRDVVRVDQRWYTIDAARYGIERMAPAEYLQASYYERWLASIEYNLALQGLITRDELDARVALLRQDPDAAPPPATRIQPPTRVQDAPTVPPPPCFAVSDAVVTRNVHPVGHTRLPRYARGKRGVIQRLHGPQTFPDTNAHGLGEQPQPLYTVCFEARELWGDSAEPRQTVSLDLWESYLEPAVG